MTVSTGVSCFSSSNLLHCLETATPEAPFDLYSDLNAFTDEGRSLYGYSLATGTWTRILNWGETGLPPAWRATVYGAFPLPDGRVLILYILPPRNAVFRTELILLTPELVFDEN